jgi:hypothetical protein
MLDKENDILCIMNDDALGLSDGIKEYAPSITVLDYRS